MWDRVRWVTQPVPGRAVQEGASETFWFPRSEHPKESEVAIRWLIPPRSDPPVETVDRGVELYSGAFGWGKPLCGDRALRLFFRKLRWQRRGWKKGLLYIIYKSGLRKSPVWFTIIALKNFFEKNEKKCLTKWKGRGILSKFAAENKPMRAACTL